MADDVVKDDRPTAQVYRLTTFGNGRSTSCAKTSARMAAKRLTMRCSPTPSSPKTSTSSSTSARRATRASSSRLLAAPARSPHPGEQRPRPLHRGHGHQCGWHRLRSRPRTKTQDDEEDANIEALTEFFAEPWPGMSFSAIRKLLRRDLERTGNGISKCSATPRTTSSSFAMSTPR